MSKRTTTGPGFINPYNFVRTTGAPLHYKIPRSHERFAGLSGRITCWLTTVSPLCVPDAEKSRPFAIQDGPNRDKERWDKRFSQLADGTLYIPGSAIKGMLRSVAEAVSNSCLSIFPEYLAVFRDNRRHIPGSRGMGQLQVGPNGELFLMPPPSGLSLNCRGLFNQIRNSPHNRNAQHLRSRLDIRPTTAAIYEQMVNDPNFTLDEHRNNNPRTPNNQEREWLLDYANQICQGDIWWYREHPEHPGEVVDFGRNFRYKWAYDPRQALDSNYHPCRNPECLCPSCAVFGMVEGRDDESAADQGTVNALAGKVAVGPARWVGGSKGLVTIDDPKILGTPKVSCRSFYLQASGAAFDVSEDEFVTLTTGGQWAPNPIRGRKFYWHHCRTTGTWTEAQWKHYLRRRDKPAQPGRPARRPPETHLNAILEAVLPSARFEFTIEFENLNRFELGLLLWTLVLPDVPSGAHHLGLGKPLGLGSVVLSIRSIDLIDRKQRYAALFTMGVTRTAVDPANTQASVDIAHTPPFNRALDVFRANLETWNGGQPGTFLQLPIVADLCVILSRNQPAPASAEVPITYPPGPANLPTDANDPHPEELHHNWFGTKGMKWSEPLLTIQEIASGCRQTRLS